MPRLVTKKHLRKESMVGKRKAQALCRSWPEPRFKKKRTMFWIKIRERAYSYFDQRSLWVSSVLTSTFPSTAQGFRGTWHHRHASSAKAHYQIINPDEKIVEKWDAGVRAFWQWRHSNHSTDEKTKFAPFPLTFFGRAFNIQLAVISSPTRNWELVLCDFGITAKFHDG